MQQTSDNQNTHILALIVEDSEADADLLNELLSHPDSENIRSELATTLRMGLELLAKNHYDVILLDLSLPDSYSISTLQRAQSAAPHVPIIIMTGFADQQHGILAVQNGAQDYLVKGQGTAASVTKAIRYAIERKKAELLVKQRAAIAVESEAKLRLALKSSQLGPWSWQLEHEPDFDNQVATLFGGISLDSYAQFLAAILETDRLQVRNAIELAKTGATEELEVEFRIVWPDESVHWIRMLGQTIFDESGLPIKMTGVCKDTTRLKTEFEADRKLALLEQREEFMTLLAHDLRNPIVGTTRILTHILTNVASVPDKIRNWLSDICLSQQSLLLLINNVMDSYRLDANEQTLFCSETYVNTFIESILAEFKPLAEWNRIDLKCHIDNLRPVAVDSQAMHRVLGNLLSNALKFTPAGGTIEIAAFDRADCAIISVKDSGIGIENESVENIFERFFQSCPEHRATGTGLGLYLCKKLVESQKATITCRSRVGEGTTFEITLPYFDVSANSVTHPVLIVGSALADLRTHQSQAGDQAFEYDFVADLASAVLYAKTGQYEAILIDVGNDQIDSVTVASTLRKLHDSIPIVAYGVTSIPESILKEAGITCLMQHQPDEVQIQKLVSARQN